jgi:hypothetical protein
MIEFMSSWLSLEGWPSNRSLRQTRHGVYPEVNGRSDVHPKHDPSSHNFRGASDQVSSIPQHRTDQIEFNCGS